MAGRYYTPPNIAIRMVELAAEVRDSWKIASGQVVTTPLDLASAYRDIVVCEPSAGVGDIAKYVPVTVRKLVMVERSKSAFERLVANVGKATNREFLAGDFMLLEGRAFDAGIMNPPYEDGQDVVHTGKMLELSPIVVVGLYRTNVTAMVSFHKMLVDRKAHLVGKIECGRPRFHGPDDKGDGARHDYAILAMSTLDVFAPPYVPWLKFFELSKRKPRAAAEG